VHRVPISLHVLWFANPLRKYLLQHLFQERDPQALKGLKERPQALKGLKERPPSPQGLKRETPKPEGLKERPPSPEGL